MYKAGLQSRHLLLPMADSDMKSSSWNKSPKNTPNATEPAEALPRKVLPSYFQKIVAELMGTYILIYAGCGSALVDREHPLTILGIAMVWGLCLIALIYTLGHISGAHFNPAVTVGLASAGKLSIKQIPIYVISQLLGSALACLTLRLQFHYQQDIHPTLTQFSRPTTLAQAIVTEFISTFLLMFSICGSATDDRANQGFAGLAIGITLMFNVIIAGPITGASLNPARSIGPAVVAGVYKNLWIYILFPILGAIAASVVYSFLRLPKLEKQKESTNCTCHNQCLPTDV